MRIGSLLIVVWLLIGALAAFQRDYFDSGDVNCADAGNIVLTVLAGPLNYAGVNPKVDCAEVNLDVDVPEPSE